jgi:hypothetical protein
MKELVIAAGKQAARPVQSAASVCTTVPPSGAGWVAVRHRISPKPTNFPDVEGT